jgi:hypothetical protein
MTIYLTKTENGKIHHFRTTVEDSGVDIIEGVFYECITKQFSQYADQQTAEAKQKELTEEKIKEGFEVTHFHECLENTLDVYDKAKWHYGGDFPEDLEAFQGYIHTGLFLGWMIDNGLVSEQFKTDLSAEIDRFKQQRLTGPQLFQKCCGGVLMLDDLSATGNRFAMAYFEFNTGQYLKDYEITLGKGLPTIYHVADNWENYNKLKHVIDSRFEEWRNTTHLHNYH